MRLLTFLARRSPTGVALAAGAGLVAGASTTGLVWMTNTLIGGGVDGKAHLLGFAGLCIVTFFSSAMSELLLTRVTHDGALALRAELGRRILSAPLRNLEAMGAPRLLATLTDDVETLTSAVSVVPGLLINGAVLMGCLAYLTSISWRVALAFVVFIAVALLTYGALARRGMRRFARAREAKDVLFEHLRALTEGNKELKLHRGRRGAFSGAFDAAGRSFRDESVAGSGIFILAGSWGRLLFFVILGLMIASSRAGIGILPEDLAASAVVLFYLLSPLTVLVGFAPVLSRAQVAFAKIEALGGSIDTEPVLAPEPLESGSEVIELRAVTHKYFGERDGRPFQLGPIDLTLRPGRVTFIVGGNGSGKSTLAKIIVGLYAPESGEIRVGGQVVTERSRQAYRERFSAVFFDFYLFRDLSGLGVRELEGEARRYLAELQLEHKVELKDGALSTTELSQGQRKRLALLTAYLEDRPIYVFDEWAADQDPTFKAIFYRHLLPDLRARGKAVVVVSHDDRYFDAADEVVRLEDGCVVRAGPQDGRDASARQGGTRESTDRPLS